MFRLFAPSKLPTLFGYSYSFVMSGSMEPEISAGDMVVCKAQNAYELNDIIVYYDEQEKVFILHRIVGKTADGFITKGDFNPECDTYPVPPKAIQGKVVLAIPDMKTYRDITYGILLTLLVEYAVMTITMRKQDLPPLE